MRIAHMHTRAYVFIHAITVPYLHGCIHPSLQTRTLVHPRAIIVDGYGNVTERKLADQSPGAALSPSVTVQRNSVVDGKRL